ncbi:MAG: alpha/beta hydrolase [Paracoccaceae bacterium]|nr:alpha/beta hydrolase [Paracoccaceae bacterium]
MSYIARTGPGPTVIFLHGIGSNSGSFEPLANQLPDHFNLIAWNAPGYLGSNALDDPWPMPADYASILDKFLKRIGVKRAHIVGHSLGTLIAVSFARKFSERVVTLTLASTANGYNVERLTPLPPKVSNRIVELERLGPLEFAQSRAANLVYDPQNNQSVVSQVESAMAQVNLRGYAQAAHLLASGNLPLDLERTSICPNFIIGAEDSVTPISQTQVAAKAWATKHGRSPVIHEIADAGHAVYLQKPAAFCKALLDCFARSCRPDPTPVPKRKEV